MVRITIAIGAILACAVFPSAAQDKKKPPPKAEPRVFFSIPLGVAAGKTTKLTLRGTALEDAKEVIIADGMGSVKILTKGKAPVPDKNPEKVGDTQVEVELSLDTKFSGTAVTLIVVTPIGDTKPHKVFVEMNQAVLAEKEGNDGFRTAQAIVLPCVLDGMIGRPKDVDVFRFEGKKGQSLVAEVHASRHGAPLDATLTLYDAKGQQVAANDDFDREHRDPLIVATLPADGVYFLSLIDSHDTGTNLHVYRLVVK